MRRETEDIDILVVEGNLADLYFIETMLKTTKVDIANIYTASRISEACDVLQQQKIGLVLLDLSLPDSFGIESFLRIKELVQKIPVIIVTGWAESEAALETLKQGAQDYLVKGEFKADLLARSIKYSIERKNAEEKVLLSEERHRHMFYKNPYPAWIYDPADGRILEVNDAALKKYEYSREDFLNLTPTDIKKEYNFSAKRVHKIDGKIKYHKKKSGNTIIAEVTEFEINYPDRVVICVQVNDITEKLRLENELLTQQKIRQQQIAEAVFVAQEEERQILGTELHDNINQILATSRLFLSAAMDETEHRHDFITKGQNYIIMAIEEIRKLSKSLITPVFIKAGLKPAIEDLVDDISDVRKMSISSNLSALDEARLNEMLKITIYRIVQEQLNNILKYAEASVVEINISNEGDKLVLSIADNGKGFDTTQERKGIGLLNIQNRAELFKGRMNIHSSPGRGCKLSVEFQTDIDLSQRAA